MHNFSFEERKENIKKIVCSGKAVSISNGFALGESFYYNIIMWYPYFYSLISEAKYSAWITITFSTIFLFGALLF